MDKALNPSAAGKTFRVVLSRNPLEHKVEETSLRVGLSVADAMREMGLASNVPASISCGVEQVKDCERATYYPGFGQILTITVLLRDGGSAALGIQLLFTSLGQAIGGPLGAFAGSVLGAVLSFTVFAAKRPDNKISGGKPPFFTVSGNRNLLAPFSFIPIVYGTDKVSPQYFRQPITESTFKKQFLVLLFGVGYGPLDISAIKIKNTDINTFDEVFYEVRAGYPDDEGFSIPDNIVNQDDFSIQLLDDTNDNTISAGWKSRTSAVGAVALSVDFSFPKGLVTINGVGNQRWLQVDISIRYALTGTDHGADGNANWLLRPILSTRGASTRAKFNTDFWIVEEGQWDIQANVTKVTVQSGGSTSGGGTVIAASTFYVTLRSFKRGESVLIKNQAMIAMRIKGTDQLNGVIDDLSVIAKSILPNYNSVTNRWDDRAGSWTYDYTTTGAGVTTYDLDVANAHTTTAPSLSPVGGAQGTGKALKMVLGAASGDGATVASKSIRVRGPRTKTEASAAFEGETWTLSFWYKSDVALASGLIAKVLFSKAVSLGGFEDFNSTQINSTTVIFSSAATTTSWQNKVMSVVVPKGMTFMRLQLGASNPSAGAKTVFFDDCSAIVTVPHVGKNSIPNGSFDYAGAITSNPAAIFRSVLQTDRGTGSAVADTRINLTDLQDWYTKAVTNGWQFNGTVDGEVNVFETLETIANAGRASLRFNDGKYSITIEESTKIARTMFTDRNILGYSQKIPFEIKPQGIRARFRNAAKNYEDDEVLAFDDGFSPAGPISSVNEILFTGDGVKTVFNIKFAQRPPIKPNSLIITTTIGAVTTTANDNGSSGLTGTKVSSGNVVYATGEINITWITAPDNGAQGTANYGGYDGTVPATIYKVLDLTKGITDATQAFRSARMFIAATKQRSITHTWVSGLEHLVAQRGDVVWLQSFLPQFGAGAARIKQVNGNPASSIVVDSKFMLLSLTSHSVNIRFNDATTATKNLSQVIDDQLTDTLIFDTALTGTQPNVGDIVVFGSPKQVMILSMEPSEAHSMRITGVEYDTSVFTKELMGFDPGAGFIQPNAGSVVSLPASPSTLLASPELSNTLIGTGFPSPATSDATLLTHVDGSLKAAIIMAVNRIPGSAAFLNLSPQSDPPGSLMMSGGLKESMSEFSVDKGAWVSTTTYNAGDLVDYDDTTWDSMHASNLGIEPGNEGNVSLLFESAASRVDVTRIVPAGFGITLNFSIEFWAKGTIANGVGPSHLISIGDDAVIAGNQIRIYLTNSNDLNFSTNGTGNTLTVVGGFVTSDPGAPAWHHYVFTLNATTLAATMFRDGVSIGSGTFTNKFSGNEVKVTIATRVTDSTQGYIGYMNDVRIWNIVLAAADITSRNWRHLTDTERNSGLGIVNDWWLNDGADITILDKQRQDLGNGTLSDDATWVNDGPFNAWNNLVSDSPYSEMPLVPVTQQLMLTNVEAGRAYNVRMRVESADRKLLSKYSFLKRVLVQGQVTVPATITGLTATHVLLGKVLLKWTNLTKRNTREYEIRRDGTSWDTAIFVARTRTTFFLTDPLAAATYTFRVKAMDTSDNFSAVDATAVITLTSTMVSGTGTVLRLGLQAGAASDVTKATTLGPISISPTAVAWAASTSYAIGALVTDANGKLEQSTVAPITIHNNPTTSAAGAESGAAKQSFANKASVASVSKVGTLSLARPWVARTAAFSAKSGGGAIPKFEAQGIVTDSGATATSITLQIPNAAPGWLLLATIQINTVGTVTAPAGWTLRANDATATSQAQWIFSKILTGNEITVLTSGGVSFTFASARAFGKIIALSNATETPSATASSTANSTTPSAPAVTPTVDTLVVHFFAWFNNGTAAAVSLTPPTMTSGSVAPTWQTKTGNTTQDDYNLWQNAGIRSNGYGVWVTLATISWVQDEDNVPVRTVLFGQQRTFNLQPGDSSQYQILVDGVVKSGPFDAALMNTPTQSSVAGAAAILSDTLTDILTGTRSTTIQVNVTNGSASNTLVAAFENLTLITTENKR